MNLLKLENEAKYKREKKQNRVSIVTTMENKGRQSEQWKYSKANRCVFATLNVFDLTSVKSLKCRSIASRKKTKTTTTTTKKVQVN